MERPLRSWERPDSRNIVSGMGSPQAAETTAVRHYDSEDEDAERNFNDPDRPIILQPTQRDKSVSVQRKRNPKWKIPRGGTPYLHDDQDAMERTPVLLTAEEDRCRPKLLSYLHARELRNNAGRHDSDSATARSSTDAMPMDLSGVNPPVRIRNADLPRIQRRPQAEKRPEVPQTETTQPRTPIDEARQAE